MFDLNKIVFFSYGRCVLEFLRTTVILYSKTKASYFGFNHKIEHQCCINF